MLAAEALGRPEGMKLMVRREDSNGAFWDESVYVAASDAPVMFKIAPVFCVINRGLMKAGLACTICYRGSTYNKKKNCSMSAPNSTKLLHNTSQTLHPTPRPHPA
jgi:hypothetical protein